MKKWVCVLMALFILLSLTACKDAQSYTSDIVEGLMENCIEDDGYVIVFENGDVSSNVYGNFSIHDYIPASFSFLEYLGADSERLYLYGRFGKGYGIATIELAEFHQFRIYCQIDHGEDYDGILLATQNIAVLYTIEDEYQYQLGSATHDKYTFYSFSLSAQEEKEIILVATVRKYDATDPQVIKELFANVKMKASGFSTEVHPPSGARSLSSAFEYLHNIYIKNKKKYEMFLYSDTTFSPRLDDGKYIIEYGVGVKRGAFNLDDHCRLIYFSCSQTGEEMNFISAGADYMYGAFENQYIIHLFAVPKA